MPLMVTRGGADDRIRTCKNLRSRGPKPRASTDFATSANFQYNYSKQKFIYTKIHSIILNLNLITGASGGIRTHTQLLAMDFESTSSTIPTHWHNQIVCNSIISKKKCNRKNRKSYISEKIRKNI